MHGGLEADEDDFDLMMLVQEDEESPQQEFLRLSRHKLSLIHI